MVRGSSVLILLTESFTSLRTRSMLTPMLNWIVVEDDPSLTDEMMCQIPGTPATASSIFLVTCVSSSDGAAPDCVIST